MSASQIAGRCKETHTYNVCDDLLHFTGLSKDEFQTRMQRKGRFHFEGEHAFWNPKSKTELTWYYATSIDYLFANALHPVPGQLVKNSAMLKSKNLEPILEYSGGVGNNVLHLAKLGLKVQYFGIGMAEYNFAQYRVWKHGYDHLVEFKKPYSEKTGYVFDPISSPLPQDESLGAILAFDVLEHIPDYHVVVQKMVKSIRVGGVIFENTPFEASSIGAGAEDLRVHLTNGGITMKEAMGPNMKFLGNGRWDKVKSD
jgi:SAM-dependent methyltransferase